MDRLVTDPVCGMKVASEDAPSLRRSRRQYFFCSEACLRTFVAYPNRAWKEPERRERLVAYFSMEICADPRIPSYAGGLGVLAGDTIRSFADSKIPVVAVTLLYANGYFEQKLDAEGRQTEAPVHWNPAEILEALPEQVVVEIEGRPVKIRAWRYNVTGLGGYVVPVLFLDTDVPENAPADRRITSVLYPVDPLHRLSQEIVLGIGGVRMLRQLGYTQIQKFHMNEGHAGLLGLELLREEGGWFVPAVKKRCVFTTHTPIPAGHDRFPYDLVSNLLGGFVSLEFLKMLGGPQELNMTQLALNLSEYINGVAKRHADVSRQMFPDHPIESITNGVHSATWTCESFRRLFDEFIPGWARDPFLLRHAFQIPGERIWQAHLEAKRRLLEEVQRRTNRRLSPDALTIGFARRATQYKRAHLAFEDPDRLREIARSAGPLQFILGGKAHAKDEPGKNIIRRIFHAGRQLGEEVPVVYLENYDFELGKLITSGVDLWLNTPQPPLEASGTSGMKAAHNGVPSFSVRDGWWIEGHIEGMTGWSIANDGSDLYDKLQHTIAPLYYRDRERWIGIMRNTIAINASFFNTHRMVQEYAANAYL